MGVRCGVLRKEQRSSLVRFCIMWGRVVVLVFGMIHGVGGPIPLKELFLAMFACSLSKEA